MLKEMFEILRTFVDEFLIFLWAVLKDGQKCHSIRKSINFCKAFKIKKSPNKVDLS